MNTEHKILAIAMSTMLLMNFLGSIASRALDFNYGYLSPISFIIYAVVGFLIAKRKSLKAAVLFSAIVGFAESTLGSVVSKLLGEPNTGSLIIEMTPVLWLFTIFFVTATAAIIGLISGAIARKFSNAS